LVSIEVNMDDPHIHTFSLLSDRVSTVEEMVVALYERKKLKEVTAFGQLDHRFLRLPYIVWRFPDRGPSACPPLREERAAPEKISSAIVSFDADTAGWGHREHCSDPKVFTAEEVERTLSCEDGEGTCIRCSEAKITSELTYVCDESLARRLQEVARQRRDPSVEVQMIETCARTLGIHVQMSHEMTVDEFLRLSVSLLQEVRSQTGGTIKHVELYPCDRGLLETWRRFRKTPSEVTRKEIRALDEHPFFEGVMDEEDQED
jgi:hypothetical protein